MFSFQANGCGAGFSNECETRLCSQEEIPLHTTSQKANLTNILLKDPEIQLVVNNTAIALAYFLVYEFFDIIIQSGFFLSCREILEGHARAVTARRKVEEKNLKV